MESYKVGLIDHESENRLWLDNQHFGQTRQGPYPNLLQFRMDHMFIHMVRMADLLILSQECLNSSKINNTETTGDLNEKYLICGLEYLNDEEAAEGRMLTTTRMSNAVPCSLSVAKAPVVTIDVSAPSASVTAAQAVSGVAPASRASGLEPSVAERAAHVFIADTSQYAQEFEEYDTTSYAERRPQMITVPTDESADNRKCFGLIDEGTADRIARAVAGGSSASAYFALESAK